MTFLSPDMIPVTRRTVLRAYPLLLGIVAGCGGSPSSPDATTTCTTTVQAISDYEVHRFRDENADRFIRDTRRESEDEPSMSILLTTVSDVDALTFARRPDGLANTLEFIRQTDFESQTVLIAQHPLSECYRAKINHITQTGDAFNVRFCTVVRDASIACEREKQSLEVIAIRLPFDVDHPPQGGNSVGIGSTCTADPVIPPQRTGS